MQSYYLSGRENNILFHITTYYTRKHLILHLQYASLPNIHFCSGNFNIRDVDHTH